MVTRSEPLNSTFSGIFSDEWQTTLLQSLPFYAFLMIASVWGRGIFLFFMRQTIIVMSRRIEYDLKQDIYACYQRLPVSFYRTHSTGDLMARISEDVTRVRMYLGPVLMYIINLLSLLCILLPIMFSINPKLAAYALLPLPFLSGIIYYVNNLINRRSERIQAQVSAMSSFTQEAFSGIRVIQSFAKEEAFNRHFVEVNETYKQRSMSLIRVESLFFPLVLLLIGLSVVLTAYVGVLEWRAGQVTLGNVIEFVMYVNLLTWPVTSLGWATSLWQRAAASQARIEEYLSAPNPIVDGNATPTPFYGSISFEKVGFAYENEPVLSNITFSLPAGKSLAVVGRVGTGKTSLLQLLCRMYDPSTGTICVDGVALSHYKIAYLRAQMSYVPQDHFLFSDTIAANVAFGCPGATKEQVRMAIRAAALEETIASFPKGLETVVGERGIMLSGGQKQRVAIARALIRRPKLLVLDDCLSAVDTDTEYRILRSISDYMTTCTTLIVSHRPSSIKLADSILVLARGTMEAFGTHDQLLKKSAYYRDFYQSQLTISK